MYKKYYIFCFAATFMICISLHAQDVFQSQKLKKVWEINKGLDVPESAVYNSFDKHIYISSIVGKFDVKDSVGYISKINLKGKIVKKEWIKGLNAPKGMGFTKTRLFVTDMDRLVEIEVPSGKIVKEYRNSHFKDLNDVAIAPNGKVYVSDSGSDCLFLVGKDSLEVFLQSKDIAGMNGIYIENNNIYIGAGDKLLSIDISTKSISVLAKNSGYVDGLIKINENTFITSDWGGKIQRMVLGKSPEKLLESKIHAADLGYIPHKGLLLVPTFTENQLVAYILKK